MSLLEDYKKEKGITAITPTQEPTQDFNIVNEEPERDNKETNRSGTKEK